LTNSIASSRCIYQVGFFPSDSQSRNCRCVTSRAKGEDEASRRIQDRACLALKILIFLCHIIRILIPNGVKGGKWGQFANIRMKVFKNRSSTRSHFPIASRLIHYIELLMIHKWNHFFKYLNLTSLSNLLILHLYAFYTVTAQYLSSRLLSLHLKTARSTTTQLTSDRPP
jgi:hypothetical protein